MLHYFTKKSQFVPQIYVELVPLRHLKKDVQKYYYRNCYGTEDPCVGYKHLYDLSRLISK